MEAVVTEEIVARQSPEAQAIIRVLLARIAELEAQVGELRARIEELERQVRGRTPQNSSLPPSTQHPHARPQPPRRKSKRKRGGQPGQQLGISMALSVVHQNVGKETRGLLRNPASISNEPWNPGHRAWGRNPKETRGINS